MKQDFRNIGGKYTSALYWAHSEVMQNIKHYGEYTNIKRSNSKLYSFIITDKTTPYSIWEFGRDVE